MDTDHNRDLTLVWALLNKAKDHYRESYRLKDELDVEGEMGKINNAWLMLSDAYQELQPKIKYFIDCDKIDTLEMVVQQLADFYVDLEVNTHSKLYGMTEMTSKFVKSKAKETQIRIDVIKQMADENKTTCAKLKSTCQTLMETLKEKAPNCNISVCAQCKKMKKPKY
jgi:hypothetical protein